jgi:hypothetical protein
MKTIRYVGFVDAKHAKQWTGFKNIEFSSVNFENSLQATLTIELSDRKREISESEVISAYKNALADGYAMPFDCVINKMIEILFAELQKKGE